MIRKIIHFRFSVNIKKDYYKILGVNFNETKQGIKKKYIELAKKNHPDKFPEKENYFKEVNEAYKILSNDESRKKYDSEFGVYNKPQTNDNDIWETPNYYDTYYNSEKNKNKDFVNKNNKWQNVNEEMDEDEVYEAYEQFSGLDYENYISKKI